MIHIDFETYSECDLRKHGVRRYAMHPSTELLCAAYARDAGPVSLWTPDQPFPEDIFREDILVAHNCQFERAIIKHVLKLDPQPLERWDDTMVLARACNLPGGLGATAAALQLDKQKDKRGATLIQRLCKPYRGERNSDPKLLDELYAYCKMDVEVERRLHEILPALSDQERAQWLLDQEINERGIPLDDTNIQRAIVMFADTKAAIDKELKMLTHVDNPNSQKQMLEWMQMQGLPVTDVKAGTLRDLETDTAVEERVVELYQMRKRSPVTKYRAMDQRMCPDHRFRDAFVFNAANTGRWSSRGIQMQNLPRPTVPEECIEDFHLMDAQDIAYKYDTDPMSVLASSIRGMIKPKPPNRLLVCDYSAIEARVLAWLADEQDVLDTFNRDGQIYERQAAAMFNTSPDKVTTDQRFLGKIAVLACGFGGGQGAYTSMAQQFGVKGMKEETVKQLVFGYRQSNPNIVKLWKRIQSAAFKAIRKPRTRQPIAKGAFWYRDDRTLRMRLPSGRCIYYWSPTITMGKYDQPVVQHQGVDSYTNKWCTMTTWHGLLVENLVQAVANDLLREAMTRLDDIGYNIIATVHDEIICEQAHGSVHEMAACMCVLPDWATGLPMDAEGQALKRYAK